MIFGHRIDASFITGVLGTSRTFLSISFVPWAHKVVDWPHPSYMERVWVNHITDLHNLETASRSFSNTGITREYRLWLGQCLTLNRTAWNSPQFLCWSLVIFGMFRVNIWKVFGRTDFRKLQILL
jgi:hypothetical protein